MFDKLPNIVNAAQSLSISSTGTLWVLLGSFLVFIMIPAIGMLEAGLTRRKNAVHGLMKSLFAAAIMMVVFIIVGFGLSFSPDSIYGTIGNPSRFFFGGNFMSSWPTVFANGKAIAGVPLFTYVLYQMMFAAVTLALIGAGVPERIRFTAWVFYSFFFGIILYPLVAHLVWSPNGLLANFGTVTGMLPGMGVRDFAGGIVVHAQAGFAGLAITLALGASLKKRAYLLRNGNGKKIKKGMHIPIQYKKLAVLEHKQQYGYSIPLAVVGTALLWFGWFGFNGGSSLELNLQGISAALATTVAAGAAGLVAILTARIVDGKYNAIMAVAGVLGGLVIITPNAGFVDMKTALLLGGLGGMVTFVATKLMEKYLYHVDDPIGGFPVHGVNGLLGSLLVPLVANPAVSGLAVAGYFFGGGNQALIWFFIQAVGAVITCMLVFFVSYVFIQLLKKLLNVRAAFAQETQGLDIVDHGTATEQ